MDYCYYFCDYFLGYLEVREGNVRGFACGFGGVSGRYWGGRGGVFWVVGCLLIVVVWFWVFLVLLGRRRSKRKVGLVGFKGRVDNGYYWGWVFNVFVFLGVFCDEFRGFS